MANLLNCDRHRHRIPGRRPSDQAVHAHPPHGMFNLIATDLGRPIGDIVTRFTDDDCSAGCRAGPARPRCHEKEVQTPDGRWCDPRIMPYRTLDNRIDGVVITFMDITERKQAADAVVRRLAAVVGFRRRDLQQGPRRDHSGPGTEVPSGFTDTAKRRGRWADRSKMLVPKTALDEWTRVMAMLARGEHVEQLETQRRTRDGRRRSTSS